MQALYKDNNSYQRPGNDEENKHVFSWDLNDNNVPGDVKLRRVELLMKLHLRATGCHLPWDDVRPPLAAASSAGCLLARLTADTSEHTPP